MRSRSCPDRVQTVDLTSKRDGQKTPPSQKTNFTSDWSMSSIVMPFQKKRSYESFEHDFVIFIWWYIKTSIHVRHSYERVLMRHSPSMIGKGRQDLSWSSSLPLQWFSKSQYHTERKYIFNEFWYNCWTIIYHVKKDFVDFVWFREIGLEVSRPCQWSYFWFQWRGIITTWSWRDRDKTRKSEIRIVYFVFLRNSYHEFPRRLRTRRVSLRYFRGRNWRSGY